LVEIFPLLIRFQATDTAGQYCTSRVVNAVRIAFTSAHINWLAWTLRHPESGEPKQAKMLHGRAALREQVSSTSLKYLRQRQQILQTFYTLNDSMAGLVSHNPFDALDWNIQ